jgi:hypothetical protein
MVDVVESWFIGDRLERLNMWLPRAATGKGWNFRMGSLVYRKKRRNQFLTRN